MRNPRGDWRLAGLTALGLLLPAAARADFEVRSPIVEEGEWEWEQNGDVTFDRDPDKGGEFSLTNELGHSVTSWWEPELELETDRPAMPGGRMQFTSLTLENTFELTDQGKYWADLGWYTEVSKSLQLGSPSDVEFGPLVQKEWGPWLHTANLFLTREVGPSQDTNAYVAGYAWQSLWRISEAFNPGFEIYGDPGPVQAVSPFRDEDTRAGPVITGGVDLGNFGEIKYEAGYLQGLTPATPHSTLRWRVEWEMNF